MSIRNLTSLVAPKSIALIGAGDRPGSLGAVVWRNLQTAGFAGSLYPVNPKHREIGGTRVYPDIASLPETPELAVLVTPAATVPGLIADLARRGTKAAAVISSGFGGPEGQVLKQQMLEAARPGLLRILGPNCLGMMAPPAGLNAGFAHIAAKPGPIAFLSQSGAILTSVIDWAVPRGIGFSHLVSLGEMADVDFGDMLDFLADDPETKAILMYVEAVTHARKFMSAARRAARAKPVIAIKAGRHAEAAKAVASHTGALAGADAVYDTAFRRAGMLRVTQLEELFDAAETLSMAALPQGDRLAILTNGGGIGILATDMLIDTGGRLAAIAPETLARLDAVLPATWSHGNPIDIIGDAPPERYARAIEALLADRGNDAILVLNCPTAVADAGASARAVVAALAGSSQCVLTSWIGEATAATARRTFREAGIPTYETPEAAVTAFDHVVRYRRNQELLTETPPSMPTAFAVDRAAVMEIVAAALAEKREMLTGPESQRILEAYGTPTLRSIVAAGAEEAGRAAARLAGPVAVKILSPDISHKSDVGGVMLGLEGEAAVAAAAATILARARSQRPQARILGVTVEPMIRRPGALELILGMSEDPQFGPILLFGQGGTAVERIADSALAMPPLNLKLAMDQIASTRIYRLLQGYRDRPPADLDAIALTLTKLSQLTVDMPEIVELDINPLLADADGVIAVDARVKVRPAAMPGAGRLAIRPYPQELEGTAVARDGTTFALRPIRPEDAPELRALIGRLSPRSVRLRFFAALRELSGQDAARLTQIDYDREMAIVLTELGPAGKVPIFGVVRLVADPDNERGEYAIVVQDDLAGRGLGTLLMNRMISYARGRGLQEIFGHVLKENEAMLRICRDLGFGQDREADDQPSVRVSLRL